MSISDPETRSISWLTGGRFELKEYIVIGGVAGAGSILTTDRGARHGQRSSPQFFSSARRNPLLIVSLLSLFIVLSRYILNGDAMAGNLRGEPDDTAYRSGEVTMSRDVCLLCCELAERASAICSSGHPPQSTRWTSDGTNFQSIPAFSSVSG